MNSLVIRGMKIAALLSATILAEPAFANFYVTSGEGATAAILRFANDGTGLSTFATDPTLTNPQSLVLGPDGNLYVNNQNAVLKFNGTTGAFMGKFVDLTANGQFDSKAIAFGPDGNLYVGSGDGAGLGVVKKYNGTTGSLIGQFTTGGALVEPMSLAFGGGKLFVGDGSGATTSTTDTTDTIEVFNSSSGAFLGLLGTEANLTDPNGMVVGPDGRLYVTNENNFVGNSTGGGVGPLADTVLAYDTTTGFDSTYLKLTVPAGNGASAVEPFGLTFALGALYVAGGDTGDVFRYNGSATVEVVTGLDDPKGIVFVQSVQSVPEPATLSLLGLGLAGFGRARRRQARVV